MAPQKKTDMEKSVESLQKDVGKITDLEKSIDEMKQQMRKLSILDRLEKKMNEDAEEEPNQTGLTRGEVFVKEQAFG